MLCGRLSTVRRILRMPSLTCNVAQGTDLVGGCTIIVYMTTIVIRGWFHAHNLIEGCQSELVGGGGIRPHKAVRYHPARQTRGGDFVPADWQRLSRVPSFGRLLMSVPLEPGDLPERNRGPMRRRAVTRYLVDTNVLSATAPTTAVRRPELIEWMDSAFTRSLPVGTTIAEIADGIAKAKREGTKRKAADLSAWLRIVLHLYGDCVLPFDSPTAGDSRVPWPIWRAAAVILQASPISQSPRRPVGMTILSRNERHFAPMGRSRPIRTRNFPSANN